MRGFEYKNVPNSTVAELLQGVDPYVLYLLSDAGKAAQLARIQGEILGADELILAAGGERRLTETCQTVYSESGQILHVWSTPAKDAFGAVLIDMNDGVRQEFPDVRRQIETRPSFGAVAMKTTTRYILSDIDEQPLLMEASKSFQDQAAELAARAVMRSQAQAVLTLGPHGWFYKPAGTSAQQPVHDWSNIVQQRELLRHRGLLPDVDEPERTAWLQPTPDVGISV